MVIFVNVLIVELNKDQNEDNCDNENNNENKYLTNSESIDYPISHHSHKNSFHAQVVDQSEVQSSKIDSRRSNSIENGVKIRENKDSPEKILEESEVNEESISFEEIEKSLDFWTEIFNKIDDLTQEIEDFQGQFHKNNAIQTFTDEYIKELRDLTNKTADIEEELEEVKNQEDSESFK